MEFQNEEIIFPYIEDNLIKALELTYPNTLPTKEISPYELGILIGQQRVIDKLKYEKSYLDNQITNDEEIIV